MDSSEISISSVIKSAVTDTIETNASFQSSSGIRAKIKRVAHAGCCDTCAALEGEWYYDEAPDDVYWRHGNCTCTVTYDPGTGKVQNVHTKTWSDTSENDKIKKRENIGLKSSGEMEREAMSRRELSLAYQKTGKLSTEEYAQYKEELRKAKDYKQLSLPKNEYANVMSKLNTDLSDEDRKHAVIYKPIGDYIYKVVNRGFDDYVIVGKEEIL